MTNTSSAEAPAMIICGMDCSVPHFSSISFNIRGTITAGETAAITAPITAHSTADNPSSLGPNRT